MADNPYNLSTAEQPSLRLAGSGPAEPLTPARPAPVPVSVLQVEDPARLEATEAEAAKLEIIPFQVRAAMVAGVNQPAIRSRLVAAKVPGVVLFRVP